MTATRYTALTIVGDPAAIACEGEFCDIPPHMPAPLRSREKGTHNE
jgi:hypothetical protein